MGMSGYYHPKSKSIGMPMKPRMPTPKKYGGGGGGGWGGGGINRGSGLPSYGPSPSRGTPSVPAPSPRTPTNSQIEMPPAEQYNPGSYSNPNLEVMANYGKGLMDPESDYYKRMSQSMRDQIGRQSAASQRAAALRSAHSGAGTQSPEMMASAADIGTAGMQAQGQAEANLRLQAPQIGAGMLQSTFQPELGYSQLEEGSNQFGAGLSENARQFGVSAGIQQQGMSNQMAAMQAQMAQQAQMFNAQQQAEQQRMQWEAMMQQMALQYS